MRTLILLTTLTTHCLATPLLLKNATLLDPSTGQTQNGHLLLENGKVSQILDAIPQPYSGDTFDVKGKWVLPGLRDLHVHAHGNPDPTGAYHHLGLEGSARSMLYAGVTAFLDLFHQENEILDARDQQRKGTSKTNPLADIFASGPILTSTGGHGTEYGMFTRVINTPRQAELEIRALAYKKPDVIKIVYDHAVPQFTTLDEPTLKHALQIATEVGIKTVIHIGTWEDAEKAIDWGASAITHTHSSPIPNALVDKFKRKNVAYIPTLSVQMELLNVSRNPLLLDRPLLQEMVPAAILEAYRDDNRFSPMMKGWLQWQRKGMAAFQKNFLKVAEAGVAVIAGTDAGNTGTFQGYSLHRELELMVQAGASPQLALKSATTTACAFLGIDCRIRPGANADFIVVSESPLKDIANTQKIFAVIHGGKVVDRQKLLSLVSKAPIRGAAEGVGGGVSVPCGHAR